MKSLRKLGILSGVVLVGGAIVVPFSTSCKKESPKLVLSQATFASEAGKYQVSEDTAVYTFSGDPFTSHNLFFDLNKFSDDNGNATDFVIDGTINFGLLVGFNENVNLYGENGSLIDLTGQTTDTYGILVGSIEAGQDTYTGNMYIDSSVTANISSSTNTSGVYFDSTAAGTITVNGNFSLFASQPRSFDCGVYFDSVAVGSTQNINGNFWINYQNQTTSAVSDVWFDSVGVNSTQNINGNFSAFSGADATCIHFGSTAAGSIQNVNGNFAAHGGAGKGCPVGFASTASGSTQNINGNFSSGGRNASGVEVNAAAAGSMTVNGNFSFSTHDSPEGVRFLGTVSGTITINGNFSFQVYSLAGDNPVAPKAKGVDFMFTPSGTCTGTATFYANATDGGN
jgi:hypothetical protein